MLAPCPSDHFDIFWSIGFTYFTKFTGLKKQLQDPKMDQSISRVVHGATSMEPDMTKEIPTLGDLWRPLSHLGLAFGNHRAKQVIGFCSRYNYLTSVGGSNIQLLSNIILTFSSVGRLCIPQTSTNKMRAFCENRSGKSALICNQQTGLWWVQVIIL